MRSKSFQRKTIAELIIYAIVFIIFSCVAFSYLYIIFWCLYSGMRHYDAIASDPFGFSAIQLRNYIDVFTLMKANGKGFIEMLINSLYFCLLGPFLCMTVTSMLSYVTAKYKFFGSRAIYWVVLVVITLPLYGSSSSMYKLLYNTGIMNTRWMILTSLNGFSMYYMYFFAFYKGLSWSYAEAAEIDGANRWQVYFKVMLPQSMTMFGSLFLMLWIGEWNSYGSALIYLPKLPTLAVGIYTFKTQMTYQSRLDILFAACTISLIPPLVIFALFNNALMSNVSLGGIKE